MPSDELHIYLDSDNKEKLLQITVSLDKSATKIVNSIISNMSANEIEDRMLQIIRDEIKTKRQNKITLES